MVVLRYLIGGYITKVVLVCLSRTTLTAERPFGDLLNVGTAIICQDQSWSWGHLVDGIAFL